MRIAAAHTQVMRARRARAQILATARTDHTAIKRALDTYRYKSRALAQRKFATGQFDDAFPAYGGVPILEPSQVTYLKPARLRSCPELTRDACGDRYKGFRRTNPRYPTIFRAYHRPLEAVIAERDRRAAAALRLRQMNLRAESIAVKPNEPDAIRSTEHELTERTRPSRRLNERDLPARSKSRQVHSQPKRTENMTAKGRHNLWLSRVGKLVFENPLPLYFPCINSGGRYSRLEPRSLRVRRFAARRNDKFPRNAALLLRKPGRACHPRPFREILADEGGKVLGATTGDVKALHGKRRHDVGHFAGLIGGVRQPLDDVARRAGGREQAKPAQVSYPGRPASATVDKIRRRAGAACRRWRRARRACPRR